MSEWNGSEPCTFRIEMEEERLNIKELYDRLCGEISRLVDGDQDQSYQRLTSKKRRHVSDINMLTTKINELKEIDHDEETRLDLNKEHKRINSMIDKFNDMPEIDENSDKTIEEQAEEYFDKLVEESDAIDSSEEEETKLTGPEWEVKAEETEDSKSIDDLLEGLGL